MRDEDFAFKWLIGIFSVGYAVGIIFFELSSTHGTLFLMIGFISWISSILGVGLMVVLRTNRLELQHQIILKAIEQKKW